MESKLHMEKIKETIKELRKEGYRAIDLENKSPDVIALKDGKIFAVEILGMQYRKKRRRNGKITGWHRGWSIKSKKQIYHMFDEVIIRTFKYPKK